MIQIAICDDDFQVCSQLEDYIRRWKEGRRLEVEIFNTGKEFEEFYLLLNDILLQEQYNSPHLLQLCDAKH